MRVSALGLWGLGFRRLLRTRLNVPKDDPRVVEACGGFYFLDPPKVLGARAIPAGLGLKVLGSRFRIQGPGAYEIRIGRLGRLHES